MATHDIFMPALSSTMTEGKIVEWLKKPGDKVERGESVLVVESDKADMDVESFQDGFLASIVMPAGSSAPVRFFHISPPTITQGFLLLVFPIPLLKLLFF